MRSTHAIRAIASCRAYGRPVAVRLATDEKGEIVNPEPPVLCFNVRMARHEALDGLLKEVSRSFYLTLRFLPGAVRHQISLAYILARATDTIADTGLVSMERRVYSLREMRLAIADAAEGRPVRIPDLGDLAAAHPSPAVRGSAAERVLLESLGRAFDLLHELSAEDRQRICDVLQIIIRGQETDLIHFGSATVEGITALSCDADLDEYTYCVAGCVGEFWTKMCRAHLFPKATLDDTFLLTSSVRFGKGLQLVNILRDLPGDLRHGRCYLPKARLAECGLEPSDLLNPANMTRFQTVYERYLRMAEDYLAEGWAYTAALPYGQIRVRLACAWPILIGVKTIAQLRSGNVLDDRQRIKISRSEIRHLIARSLLRYPFPSTWDCLFDLARK
ncbi:MAG TPA: phytoene/squalene synthase family protein [Acidobacteriota bacterium]|nr:phytoene/squalene synthase family protein [Acidobacteriota bacterium]